MKILGNTLLLLASLLISLLVGEWAVRLMYPVPVVGYGVWGAYPGSMLQWDSLPDNHSAIHRYNGFGFRGENFSIPRSEKLRLVAVGDSYTEGMGAAESESWPVLLERTLSGVEVLNLGDGGSNPQRYSKMLARVAFPLRPDHILLCVIPSDFYGMARGYGGGLAISDSFPDPLVDAKPEWLKPFVRWFRGYTYLLERMQGEWPIQSGRYWRGLSKEEEQGLIDRIAKMDNVSKDEATRTYNDRISRLGDNVLQATRDKGFNPSLLKGGLIYPGFNYRVGLNDMLIGADEVRNSMEEWLRWYAESSHQRRIVPWLVYFPHASQVVEGPWGIYEDSFYNEGAESVNNTEIAELLEQLSLELDIQYVDLTPALKAHGKPGLFLRYDTHPTAEAYQVAANEIAQRFQNYQQNHPSAKH